MAFDISEDELPIFQAETEDHLTTLEDGLVRLEQEDQDPELLQALFRAAHTIKGTAGMIGHKRLVDITHVLENAFDAVRKDQLPISTNLIDLCLETVDILRSLRDEVITNETCACDVSTMIDTFKAFLDTSIVSENKKVGVELKETSEKKQAGNNNKTTTQEKTTNEGKKEKPVKKAVATEIQLQADISPTSVASAARAFQILMVLQASGKIIELVPDQKTIESAAPVGHLTAKIEPKKSKEEIKKDILNIPEIDRLVFEDEVIQLVAPEKGPEKADENASVDLEYSRLGEYLLSKNLISANDLKSVLEKQKTYPADSAPLLGQLLVSMGFLAQSVVDQAIEETMNQKRNAILNGAENGKVGDHLIDRTVRTSVERLDSLMNLVGELITDRNRLIKIHSIFERDFRGNENTNMLSEAVVHIGRITDQLQEEVMHIRMLPVANVFKKFPRMVRDMAQKTGKEIDLIIKGQETELDRSVIEEINDPLIHLIRNSVDHGVELPDVREKIGKSRRGTITLSARHDQGRIVISVEDDGGGINIEKIKAMSVKKGTITQAEADSMSDEKAIDLIFESGLSTAEKVTDISGRGVGMDIVRSNIERLNGSILVESKMGSGSVFQIILPLTLAIVPTLLVKVLDSIFAIPLMTVVETQKLEETEFQTVNGKSVVVLREKIIPLVKLAEVFDLSTNKTESSYSYIVVVKTSKQEVGIVVEKLLGEEEVVVKSFGHVIGDVQGISSAAILGDGQIALIVDVQGLIKLSTNHL
jgi:two-component system, chemotaxis family, sensor kinase CheA